MKIKIELQNLYKKLGDKQILDDLSLEFYEGETFVLIGQSGVGKSVLLKHIIGLMKPDSGSIVIDGKEMSQANETEWALVRKNLSMLFQSGALFDSLTVGQNILFALDQIQPDLSVYDKESKVLHALEMVGLPGIEDFMPSELSGGMMKRVALARAIVAEPDIVLFDEPTTGLDPIMTANINELILNLKKQLNTTFIVVTHDINSAKTISDRIGMIYKGQMIFKGDKTVFEHTDNAFLRQFIEGVSKGPITEEYNKIIETIKSKKAYKKHK